MQIGRSLQSFFKDQAGSLTVEFVALTPMLLVALIFAIDFGRELWAYDTIVRDLRTAVRYLSRTSNDCGASTAAYRTQAESLAKCSATSCGTSHFPWNNGTPTFSYSSASFSTPAFNENASVITMTANVPVTLLTSQFVSFFNKYTSSSGNLDTNPTLSISYQARCIGN